MLEQSDGTFIVDGSDIVNANGHIFDHNVRAARAALRRAQEHCATIRDALDAAFASFPAQTEELLSDALRAAVQELQNIYRGLLGDRHSIVSEEERIISHNVVIAGDAIEAMEKQCVAIVHVIRSIASSFPGDTQRTDARNGATQALNHLHQALLTMEGAVRSIQRESKPIQEEEESAQSGRIQEPETFAHIDAATVGHASETVSTAIKIICCTPTLAYGVDTPAYRAIIKDVFLTLSTCFHGLIRLRTVSPQDEFIVVRALYDVRKSLRTLHRAFLTIEGKRPPIVHKEESFHLRQQYDEAVFVLKRLGFTSPTFEDIERSFDAEALKAIQLLDRPRLLIAPPVDFPTLVQAINGAYLVPNNIHVHQQAYVPELHQEPGWLPFVIEETSTGLRDDEDEDDRAYALADRIVDVQAHRAALSPAIRGAHRRHIAMLQVMGFMTDRRIDRSALCILDGDTSNIPGTFLVCVYDHKQYRIQFDISRPDTDQFPEGHCRSVVEGTPISSSVAV